MLVINNSTKKGNMKLLVVSISVVAIGALLRIAHNVKRAYEYRCRQCGDLRMKKVHYLEVSPGAQYSSRMATCYDTYTFRTCKKCLYLMTPKCDSRYLSWWAIYWKKTFKPHHFKSTPEIQSLFREGGLEKNGISGISSSIKPSKIPVLHPIFNGFENRPTL